MESNQNVQSTRSTVEANRGKCGVQNKMAFEIFRTFHETTQNSNTEISLHRTTYMHTTQQKLKNKIQAEILMCIHQNCFSFWETLNRNSPLAPNGKLPFLDALLWSPKILSYTLNYVSYHQH